MPNDKPTPGPWSLCPMSMFIFGPDMEMIASEDDEGNVIVRGAGRKLPMEANGKLLAAAPDLLDACKAVLLSAKQRSFSLGDARKMAEAAIAKAEGR